MTAISNEFKDSRGYLGYTIGAMAVLSLLLLLSLCGICRSKDMCFQKPRQDDTSKLVEESADISNIDDAQAAAAGNIEMPDRAKRYQIRQRNFDID